MDRTGVEQGGDGYKVEVEEGGKEEKEKRGEGSRAEAWMGRESVWGSELKIVPVCEHGRIVQVGRKEKEE